MEKWKWTAGVLLIAAVLGAVAYSLSLNGFTRASTGTAALAVFVALIPLFKRPPDRM